MLSAAISYLKGTIFVVYYLTLMFLIGTAFSKQNNAPGKTVYGFIVHAFLVAVVGIPVQMFQVPWKFFFIYMILLHLILWGLSIYKIRKNKIKVFEERFKDFIKNYWFVLFTVLIVTSMLLFQNVALWDNAGADDGYYLVKIFTYPLVKDPYNIDVRTGLHLTQHMFDIRNLNVFELEDSVYLYVVNIYSTLFARLFLAFINYFIFASSIYVFSKKVIESLGYKIKKSNIQYLCFIFVVLCFSQDVLAYYGIIELRDHWMINRFMYYGSALVKACGFVWLLTILLDTKKPNKNMIIQLFVVAVVLISKSSIALPIILLSMIAYIIKLLVNHKSNIGLLIFALLLAVFGLLIKIFEKNILTSYAEGSNNYDYLQNNIFSIYFLIVIAVIIITTVIYYNKMKKLPEIVIYLISVLLLMILPIVNYVAKLVSVYSFVYARTLASVMMLLAIVALLLLGWIFKEYHIRVNKFVSIPLVLLIVFSSLTLQKGNVNDLIVEAKSFKHNINFESQCVIDLANVLNELENKKHTELISMMPSRLYENKAKEYRVHEGKKFHPDIQLGSAVRQFSPTTISMAHYWYNYTVDDSRFKTLDKEKLTRAYDDFLYGPNKKTFKKFKDYIQKYPFNCIVLWYSGNDDYMNSIGYKLYKKVDKNGIADLYVYYKD